MAKKFFQTRDVLEGLKKAKVKDIATGKEITGKRLRRYLRQIPKYNDGNYTHYVFEEKEASNLIKMVKLIVEKRLTVADAMKEINKRNKKKDTIKEEVKEEVMK